MKSFLTAVALVLLAQLSFGQAKNIKIINSTSCPIYISLRLSEPTINPCAPVYEGTFFMVPAFSVQSYDYTNYPGSSATGPQYFIYAKILPGPQNCTGLGDAIGVGETCYSFPQTAGILAHAANCSVCDDVKAIWHPQPNPNDFAVLEIIP